jgi:hypothetical protein
MFIIFKYFEIKKFVFIYILIVELIKLNYMRINYLFKTNYQNK